MRSRTCRIATSVIRSAERSAGISAASGIPTFRGDDGLWRKVRPETIATPEAFEQDPLSPLPGLGTLADALA